MLERGGFDGPDDDVELGEEGRNEVAVVREAVVEVEGGGAAKVEVAGEGAFAGHGQELLGGPESYGGCAGAGAFEADFAEVEIG